MRCNHSVKDVLDSLDVAKATVLGHSMGGYVALALGERHPDRVERLGLIASHPFADDEEARRQRLDTIERVKHEGPQVVPASMRENLFSSNTMDERPSIISGVYAIMKNASIEAIIGANPPWRPAPTAPAGGCRQERQDPAAGPRERVRRGA